MMRKLLITICGLIISSVMLSAQDLIPSRNLKGKWGFVDNDGAVVIKQQYDSVVAFNDGIAKVKKGDKWGYIAPDGSVVINIQYTEMQNWDENGICKVGVGGKVKDGVVTNAKYGFINKNGKVIIKPEYNNIGAFNSGVAYIQKGSKYGYINDQYQIIIPCEHTVIGKYNSEGLVWANKGGVDLSKDGNISGGKWGIYDLKGNVVVPLNFGAIIPVTKEKYSPYAKLSGLKSDLHKANRSLSRAEKKNKQKEIDAAKKDVDKALEALSKFNDRGNSTLPEGILKLWDTPEFSATKTYRKKLDTLEVKSQPYYIIYDNIKIGLIDEKGNVLIKPDKYNMLSNPREGKVLVIKDLYSDKIKCNYVNLETGLFIWPKFLEVNIKNYSKEVKAQIRSLDENTPVWFGDFRNDVARIKINDKWSLIDKNGNYLITDCEEIKPFLTTITAVKKGGFYAAVNNQGRNITPYEYTAMNLPSNGMIGATDRNNKAGYLTTDGKVAIPFEYDDATYFHNGLAAVCKNGKWGFVDEQNNEKVALKWNGLSIRTKNMANRVWVKGDDNLYHLLDIDTNAFVFDKGYLDVDNFNEQGFAVVKSTENAHGIINLNNETVVPFIIENFTTGRDVLEEFMKSKKNVWAHREAFQYMLLKDDSRNSYHLEEDIPENMWDF